MWNLHTGGCETVADNLGSAVGRVAWLAGVERLVWGSTVRYWTEGSQPINRDKPAGGVIDRATGKRCWTFQSFIRDDYQTLSAAPDGGRLAVLEIPGRPRGAFLLDSSSGKLLATLFHEQHACGPLSVCIGSDSDTVAVGYAPTDVIVWDASRQDVIQILDGHTNWVVSLAFSKDGRFLISGAGDSTARVWDWRIGKEIGRIRFPGTCSYVESVGFSPGGDTAFALSAGRLVIARTPKPGVTVR